MAEPSPTGTIMHVGDISMWYPSGKGLQHTIYTEVPILDEYGQPVSDATVYLEATLPDSSVKSLTGRTESNGIATFIFKSKLAGTYTSEVIGVVKEDLTYDPSGNIETNETLTIL